MENRKKASIIIVDDHESFRQGLKFFIENELGHEIIAEASDGKEFLSLPNVNQADVILMDMRMPDMGGVEAAKRVLWDYSYLKIIAITMFQDEAYLKQLLEAGIKGCVFKGDIHVGIGPAIEAILNHEYYFPRDIKTNR